MDRLGATIREVRERRGWTTHRLSQKAEVGDSYLRRLESGGGSGQVGLDVLWRIADALGIPLVELIRRTTGEEHDELVADLVEIYDAMLPEERQMWLRMGRILMEATAHPAIHHADATE